MSLKSTLLAGLTLLSRHRGKPLPEIQPKAGRKYQPGDKNDPLRRHRKGKR